MSEVYSDLLGALKGGRAGRQPDPSSTRGSNPRGATPSVESSGPLHRISEASVTGAATVEEPADAVNVALTLPEQESPAMLKRRDDLDATCSAPTSPVWPDSDEVEAEQEYAMWLAEKREQMGLGELDVWDPRTGEVWTIPDLTPAQKRMVAKSKRAEKKPPIVKLADEDAPANPEPVSERKPAATHPWRRYKEPAEVAGERRAA